MKLAVEDTKDGLWLTQVPAMRNEETLEQIALESIFATVIAEAETARDIASEEGHRESLTPEDISNLNAVLGHEVSANTRKNYMSQWRRFCEWAGSRGNKPAARRPFAGGGVSGRATGEARPQARDTPDGSGGDMLRTQGRGAFRPLRGDGSEGHAQERQAHGRLRAETGEGHYGR